jgi:hypothetical protein
MFQKVLMSNRTLAIAAVVAVTAAFMLEATLVVTNGAPAAYAKITEETTDTGCTNNGGNSPGGQQPSCTGGGLTQETETENVNPSGQAPPGQNKDN